MEIGPLYHTFVNLFQAGGENVSYSDGNSEGVRFVDINGTIIQVSEADIVSTEEGSNEYLVAGDTGRDIPVIDASTGSNINLPQTDEMEKTLYLAKTEANDPIKAFEPDEAGDGKREEEEDINILLFCQYCGENLMTLEDLRTHLKDEHDVDDDMQSEDDGAEMVTESLFPSCQTCGSTFLDEEDLKVHRKKCESEERDGELENIQHVNPVVKEEFSSTGHKCQMCDKVFKVRGDLDIHIEKGHHDPVFENHGMVSGGVAGMYHKCPYCQRIYMSKWHKKSLIKHIKEEHPDEPWNVPFELVEADKTKIFRRLNAQKGGYENCFSCRFCSRKFLWQKSLSRHYKDFHSNELNTLGENEVNELLGTKQNRSLPVIGDEGNFSCSKCGKQFIWEKSLRRHAFSCKAGDTDQSVVEPYEHLLKCLYCSLVSKYTCSMRKHMKRFHSKELGGLDVHKIDIPIVDMETYGHSLISIDRRPADIRLKDCPVVFKCKFCDYASAGQSNLKRHLMSIKHNFTAEELKKMKLSSFKVIQKRALKSAGRPKGKRKSIDKPDQDDTLDDDKGIDDGEDILQDNSNKLKSSSNLGKEELIDSNDLNDGRVDDEIESDGVERSRDLESEPCTLEKLGLSAKTKRVNKQSEVQIVRESVSDDSSCNAGKDSECGNNAQDRIVDEESRPFPDPESFLCPICNTEFKEFPVLIEHCQVHVNIKIDFICSVCDNAFPIFESLKRHHREMHSRQKCKVTKLNSISMKEVKYKQSKVKAFECPYCDLILSQNFPLKHHVLEEHKEKVLTISIKSESSILEKNCENVISGFQCGVCECSYITIEDMVTHMQIIHPFVDRSTQGQGSSDSGSVRKSGRKRKLKYPGFDEEETMKPTSKKTKLDFKSPISTKEISKKDVDLSPVTKKKVSPVTSLKKSSNTRCSLSGDKMTPQSMKRSQEDEQPEKDQRKKKADHKQTSEIAVNPNFQPDIIVTSKTTANTPEAVKSPKKRGRKRKDDQPKSADRETDIAIARNESSYDLTSKNKCPHCSFTCKRSSALAFHINFNHVKIKDEPLDSDSDIYSNQSPENAPNGKKNSFGSETDKISSQSIKKDRKDIKISNKKSAVKTEENKIQQKSKKNRQIELQNPDVKRPCQPDQLETEEVFDEEDIGMLDDSDNDQDYKPTEEGEEDGEDEPLTDQKLAAMTPNRYKCIFCKARKFTSARILERHIKRDHPEKTGSYSIEDCEETTESSVDNVPKSLPVDNIPKTSHEHKCIHCGKRYPSREQVLTHVKETHPTIIAEKIKITSLRSNAPMEPVIKTEKTEIKTSNRGRKVKCSVCNFLCGTSTGLKKHMVRCHPDKIKAGGFITELYIDAADSMSNFYKCPHCRYKTYYRSSVKRHVKTAHPQLFLTFAADKACGIVPDKEREREQREKVPENAYFSCPYCGIINKWKKSIGRHIRVFHPGESCDVDIPPLNTPNIGEVKKYERFNIGYRKKLQCLHCSFSCKILTHMTKHIQKVHDLSVKETSLEGQGAFQCVYEKQAVIATQDGVMDASLGEIGIHKCPYCGLTYGWKKSLFVHVKRIHTEQLNVFETMDKMLTIVARTAGTYQNYTDSKKKVYMRKDGDFCEKIYLKSDISGTK